MKDIASVQEDLNTLTEKLGDGLLEKKDFRGEATLILKLDSVYQALEICRHELNYEMLLDVSSLDHFGDDPRFEIVYEIASLDDTRHLRLRARVEEEQEVPTVCKLWAAADWHEREVYDMMGIRFTDHPNMKRILMWEGYPFFPLRKDFPLAGRPTEIPDVASTGVAPLEGGPFVTSSGAKTMATREPRARHQE